MRKPVIIIYFLFIFICYPVFCESLSNIYGKVIDEETKEPVQNATIIINVWNERGGKLSTQSNEKGEFEFKEFPADDFEYEIDVCNPLNFVDPIFYKQRIRFGFKLQKGKNLYLRPIELKRGIRIEGNVRLWDGSIINKARIRFKLKNKDSLDSIRSFWQGTSIDENGHYISPLIPGNVELIMEADLLEDRGKKEAYGEVTKLITINKNNSEESIDVIVPNILTEIKGKVENKSGFPLSNQTIGLDSPDVEVLTDEIGHFKFKHIRSGKIELYITYGVKKFRTHTTQEIQLDEGESIFFNIIVDEDDFFRYTVTKGVYER